MTRLAVRLELERSMQVHFIRWWDFFFGSKRKQLPKEEDTFIDTIPMTVGLGDSGNKVFITNCQ